MTKTNKMALCIGAPKGGTTWFFDNIKEHPSVWTLPYKSTQYFAGKAKWARDKKWKREKNTILANINPRNFFWHLDHFLNPKVDDNWYVRQFKPGKGQIPIDISPSYSALDKPQVIKIKELIGDTKIIYFLRNPVERVWSHTKLDLFKNAQVDPNEVSVPELITNLSREGQKARTNYMNTIRIWREVFGESNVGVFFFDQISEDPEGLLADICKFLNIDYSESYFESTARRNIFKGVEVDMPEECRNYLVEEYGELIESVQKEYGSYSNNWI